MSTTMLLCILAITHLFVLCIGIGIGWLLTLRNGLFTFKTGNMKEDPMSFGTWRDRYLKTFGGSK